MAQGGEDQADSAEGRSQAALVERLEVGIREAYSHIMYDGLWQKWLV